MNEVVVRVPAFIGSLNVAVGTVPRATSTALLPGVLPVTVGFVVSGTPVVNVQDSSAASELPDRSFTAVVTLAV